MKFMEMANAPTRLPPGDAGGHVRLRTKSTAGLTKRHGA